MSGLHEFRAYPYWHPDKPECMAFWQIRARRIDDGQKVIWYRRPSHGPERNNWRRGSDGKPSAKLANRCLYGLPLLRRAIAERAPYVIWCEGEKDVAEAELLLIDASAGLETESATDGPAVSHHGGALKATPQQAEHFRGYRGRVLIAVDWDDAGAACALRRWRLLRKAGLEPRQLRLVRPADGALALPALPPSLTGGGGGEFSGADRAELEAMAAGLELAAGPGGGADLYDHATAGYGLRDLVRVRPPELVAAARRYRTERAKAGHVYGAPDTGWISAADRARAAEDWATYKAIRMTEGESS